MKNLTVGITTYNNEPHIYTLFYDLSEQVKKDKSILDNIDFIIYDDNSSKAEFLNEAPDFIKIIKAETNSGGPSAGRNEIITVAESKYVLFIDGDDKIIRSLVDLNEELNTKNEDIIFSEVIKLGTDGQHIKSPFIYTDMLMWNGTPKEVKEKVCVHQTGIWSIYSVKYLRDNDLRYKSDIRYEDNYFLYSILLTNPVIGTLSEPYYGWCINHESFSYSQDSIAQRVQLYKLTLEMLENNKDNKFAPYILYSVWNQSYSNIIRNYPKLDISATKDFFHALNNHTKSHKTLIRELKSRVDVQYVDRYFVRSEHLFADSFAFIYVLKNLNLVRSRKHIIKKKLVKVFTYLPMDKNKIVMTSHYGDYGSNPKYMYLDLKQKQSTKKIIYFTKDKSLLGNEDFRDYNNKLSYYYNLYTAKEVYFDSWMDPSLKKRKNQKWTQMWHGYPYKKIFTDIEIYKKANSQEKHQNKVNNINKWDEIISVDDNNTAIFEKLFPQVTVVQSQYQRIDWLIANKNNQKLKEQIKVKYNLDLNTKYTLYAPTYRPYKVYLNQTEIMQLVAQDHTLIFNPHPMLKTDFEFNGLELENVDIQEILLVIDELITDYSSIKYDFLQINSEEKVKHYTPDLELYKRYHGLYE